MTRAAILVLALLAGCTDATQQRQLILDDVTNGCRYVGRQTAAMTPGDLKPLLDDQGKHVCNRPAAQVRMIYENR